MAKLSWKEILKNIIEHLNIETYHLCFNEKGKLKRKQLFETMTKKGVIPIGVKIDTFYRRLRHHEVMFNGLLNERIAIIEEVLEEQQVNENDRHLQQLKQNLKEELEMTATSPNTLSYQTKGTTEIKSKNGVLTKLSKLVKLNNRQKDINNHNTTNVQIDPFENLKEPPSDHTQNSSVTVKITPAEKGFFTYEDLAEFHKPINFTDYKTPLIEKAKANIGTPPDSEDFKYLAECENGINYDNNEGALCYGTIPYNQNIDYWRRMSDYDFEEKVVLPYRMIDDRNRCKWEVFQGNGVEMTELEFRYMFARITSINYVSPVHETWYQKKYPEIKVYGVR
ncbi:hypothetical protein [Persicobacter psychrovividus]|uniref:Uncharacterized protein n=1 Tax=Persicobacter psychrovividus TaxID=387638 RepID=A0ABM7VM60_9BACT|nr:hypothetical protein PEPS_43790 [Persicobacter psychrovividus]